MNKLKYLWQKINKNNWIPKAIIFFIIVVSYQLIVEKYFPFLDFEFWGVDLIGLILYIAIPLGIIILIIEFIKKLKK